MTETLTLTHGCSLSNLPLFVAVGAGHFEAEGLRVVAPPFTLLSSTVRALADGTAELGTAPFTQPLIDARGADPPKLVAGSGLMGIAVLARPGITRVEDLAGRPVGTFRGDPLEVLLHDLLASAGMTADDVELRHLDDIQGAVEDFSAGRLAGVTLAEPHADRLRRAGAEELSDGTDLWGDPFPDTVLVASSRLLAERPHVVSAAIRALLAGERSIREDLTAAVALAAPHFPGYGLDDLVRAAVRQPPCVDVRPLVPAIHGRWPSLQALGLAPPDLPLPTQALALELLDVELARGIAPEHHPIRGASL